LDGEHDHDADDGRDQREERDAEGREEREYRERAEQPRLPAFGGLLGRPERPGDGDEQAIDGGKERHQRRHARDSG